MHRLIRVFLLTALLLLLLFRSRGNEIPLPHSLATEIFHHQYEWLHASVVVDRHTGIYNIQAFTNPLLLRAVSEGRHTLLDSLAAILLHATTTLRPTEHYPLNSWRSIDSVPLGRSYRLWLFPRHITIDGERIATREEVELASSQFLFLAAQLLRSALTVTPGLYPHLDSLVTVFPDLLLEHHYQRWIIDTRTFRLTGWSCVKGVYNHHEFLELKRNHHFRFRRTECPIVTDTDLFIIGGLAIMVAAHSEHPHRVPISTENMQRYRAYLKTAEELLDQRIATRTIHTSEGPVDGFAFDNGLYRDYKDHRYALYTDTLFPPDRLRPPKPKDAAWDMSHARRFFFVFNAMEMVAEKAQLTLNYGRYLDALAQQFYHVVYTDTTRHLFANYLNGDNGWYRVNYHGTGFGYPPYSMSIAALEGGWFFLGSRYPPIADLGIILWEAFHNNPEFFNRYYGALFRDHKPVHRTFDTSPDGNIRLTLLQWLPAL